jgi:hypothetical protein
MSLFSLHTRTVLSRYRKLIITLTSLLVVLVIETALAHKAGEAGATGSPGEPTCANPTCHDTYAVNSGTGSTTITSNIPSTGYVPGTTYSVTVTVSQTGVTLFGFGFEALNSSNTNAGTIAVTSSSTMQLQNASNGRVNIVHRQGGGAGSGIKAFTFNWTAPSANIGNVTFYAAGNASNSSNTDSGDRIYTTSVVIPATPTITTGIVNGSPFCAGETGIVIPFTASGIFGAGNVFTAELSDNTGSFASPTTIGSVSGTTSGSITSSIGLPSISGTGYRIRVVSSTPAIVGTNNGSDLLINAPPTTSNAGRDTSICNNSFTLSGNTPVTGTGTWSLLSGSGTITTPASPTTTLTNLSVGINKFIWSISNAGCTTSRDTVTITVASAPSQANAGADQQVCSSSTTLTGNAPSSGTGSWSVITGSSIVTSLSNPSSGVTGLDAGVNTFVWTISTSSCGSSSDTVTIIRSLPPTTSNAGPDQTICGTVTTLVANGPSVGAGSWSIATGSATFANPTSPVSQVSALGTGSNLLVWTISNGACQPSRDTVRITSVASPSAANAGPDQTACVNFTPLNATPAAIGTGTWSVLSGAGTFSNVNAASTTVTGIASGINKYLWTVSNPPCAANTDTLIVDFSGTISIADAGPDVTICSDSTRLAGFTPTNGTGMWTVVSGSGNFTNSSNPQSDVTGLSVGNNVLRWTITNGACTPTTDDVTITVKALPTIANAGSDQTVCTAVATLSGNNPSIGTGLWTVVSGSGTFASATSPATTVSGLAAGVNTFRWSISNSPCTSSSDDVVITKSGSLTISNAGPDQQVCSANTVLAANTPTTGTGAWSVISGGATVTTPSSPTSGVSGLSVGQNKFEWVISNGGCTPSRDTVIITRADVPAVANAGADQSVCDSVVTLTGNVPSVGTGTWTRVSGSGTIQTAGQASTLVQGLVAGTNVFRWSISNAPCTTSFDEVTITRVLPPSVANAGADQNICNTSVTLTANSPTIGNGTWTLVSGTGTIVSPSNATTLVTGVGSGVNVFRWTISNSPCSSSSDDVSITNCPNSTISTSSVTGSPFCSTTSYSLMVSFTITGSFNGFYSVELSDAVGSFTNPVVIGSGSTSPISAIIPAGTIAGTGYRIRVVNSAPSVAGADNGADLSINTCANSLVMGSITGSPFCSATSYQLFVPFTAIGSFSGNFLAELSDATGSFANPTIIGFAATSPISATIPSNTPTGYGYLIRIKSSSPSIISNDNLIGLEINSCLSITTDSISGSPFCSNTGYDMSVPFESVGPVTAPFKVQLSDVSGSFANPVYIGYGYSSPIAVTIPSGTAPGNNYKIRVVDNDGTVGSPNPSILAINTCTGISEYRNSTVLKVYPNPNNGSFSVISSKNITDHVLVRDVLGNVIFEKEVSLTEDQSAEFTLDVPSGIYFLSVNNDVTILSINR